MTMSILSLVIDLGIESAVSRFYFDFEEQEKRNRVVSTAFLGFGAMALVVTLLLLPFSGIMARSILGSIEMRSFFIVALVTLGMGMIGPIAYAYFRATQRSLTLMVFQVSKTTVSLGLNIYYVVFAGMGVYGILLASLISTGVFTAVMTFYVLRITGVGTDFKLLWQMMKFGLPLIPSNLSGYLVHASDRFFIKEYATMTLTGLYSLGYKFGALVNQFVTSPFIQIWTPRRFEYFNRDDSERIYARIFTYFVTFSLFVGLQLSILSKEIIQIATAEPYWSSYKVVPIIVLSYIIFSFHYHFNIGILMKKQTKYIAYINIVNGILNLALNFILIKKYDIWGAAYATLICFIFKAALTYYYSNRFYKIQMEWRRLIMLFLVAFAAYFAIIQIETGSVWINLPVKAAAGCGYALALYLARFFTPEEIKRFKRIVKTRRLDFD
jgi:O-antigen/teichoic acid export membrane protein